MEKEAYDFMISMESDHFWSKTRRNIISKVLFTFLKNKNTKTLSVLEIGCGSGFNINYFKDNFKEFDGCEFNLDMLEIAKQNNPQSNITQGGLPFDLKIDKKYDVIFLLDVLEHIQDDENSLIEIKKLLNPNGILIITVPALQMLWSIHDVANHHFRRYNVKTLKNLCKKSNLTIKYISYFNFLLFPLILVQRFVYKLTKQSSLNETKFKNNIFNKLLYFIFNLESKLLPKIKLPYGSSIIVVIANENI